MKRGKKGKKKVLSMDINANLFKETGREREEKNKRCNLHLTLLV